MDFLYMLVGVFSGITSGLFGLGGGTVIVPVMTSLGFSMHHAVAISVFQMIFASTFGSIINYKKRLFSLRDGIFLGIGGMIGASFSGLVLQVLSEVLLTFIFLCLMCISLYKFLTKKSSHKLKETEFRDQKLRYASVMIFAGAFTGVFAISLGIGGGLILIPILMYFLGFDAKKISVLSLFFIICSSVSGAISFFRHGVIDEEVLHIGMVVGISAMVGVSIGIHLIQKISSKSHKVILTLIYIFSILVTGSHFLQKASPLIQKNLPFLQKLST
ncbi:sulfite exporter TauE/SafE family protein [Helicobacter mustelae]|uniref:Probable membrane transporter protein n=1 Tax=Helicobacter mustelae (strain ATCC 43772 / CCUG 25715 / CIP 103759 / LMG 18044 / NCTC 12198 / R85-136P) TaxID=679897 RepID=D3UIU0_HELM1|nr:sulfite exporter TauE/SafE family protein [Helicobacter mustelae]CBG40415.1 putative inner membrane protein [Helicobacter mustelae 12198]SQH71915.1 Integral membrane protein [Helicobacter mustelae]STP13055.1 Integral membrane protein [Helicobacter mustelae]